jgi:hypothetical protein
MLVPDISYTATENENMQKCITLMMIVSMAATMQIGCSKSFWGGAAVGAAGAGVAYEYSKKKQMDTLERDFEAGRIDKDEYLRRKKQIQEGSIIY